MSQQVDPEFSRQAALIVGSGYFGLDRPDAPPLGDIDARIAFSNEIDRQRDLLIGALRTAGNRHDLAGEAKHIYDEAGIYLRKEYQAWEEGRPPHLHDNDFGMPRFGDEPLSDEEQKQVDAAIQQAKRDQRQDVVEWLGSARRDSPLAVREVLAEMHSPGDDFEEEDEEDEDGDGG